MLKCFAVKTVGRWPSFPFVAEAWTSCFGPRKTHRLLAWHGTWVWTVGWKFSEIQLRSWTENEISFERFGLPLSSRASHTAPHQIPSRFFFFKYCPQGQGSVTFEGATATKENPWWLFLWSQVSLWRFEHVSDMLLGTSLAPLYPWHKD